MTSAITDGGHWPPSGAAQGEFFVCDIFGASPKDDLGSMEHPIFSLATRPDRRVLEYTHNGTRVTVTPSVRGRATIHDKDILIYCISQLVAAMNAGRETSRKLVLTAHDLLVATGRDTGGDSYARLREAFERLAGTRITTNLETGGAETTTGFGLIEAWEIRRKTRGGRMVSVAVTLSDWLYRAVLAKSVLTLSRDYFRLRRPLERRIYELARKHCGRQAEWQAGCATLHKKAGSAAPLRVFRASLRRMVAENPLPEYEIREGEGDIFHFTRRTRTGGPALLGAPRPTEAALDAARARRPGADVHALVAEWQAFWADTGRKPLRNPDRAFLGWLARR